MSRSKNIYTLIKELEEIDWNYYAAAVNNITLDKPFISDLSARDFILKYFAKGGKHLVTNRFNIADFGTARAEHTVSIFFIGILIYQNSILKDKVFYNGKVNARFDFFSFIWFVSSLAHDFAFYKEKKVDEPILWENNPTINDLLINEGIYYNLLEQKVPNVPQDLFKLVSAYFNYRHLKENTDHGILAGLVAYDILVENRKVQQGIGDDILLWEDYLDDEYAYAAATIAIHNIWLIPKGHVCEVITNSGLAELIGREPVKFDEGPLYYLLSIVDTIDPFKAYSTKETPLEVSYVLRNVKIKFISKTCFEITVSKKLNPEVLHLKGKNLLEFLDLNVIKVKNGIRIEIIANQ